MQKKTYLFMAIVVILSLLASTSAFAQTGGTPRGAVPVDAEVAADLAKGVATGGPVSVVVHLDKASLASVGKFMSAAERVQYAAEVAALQDQVAAQVTALGGTVLGRFKTLSSGLAVRIDASRVQDLRSLASVVAVRRMGNYELDLNDTVPFIGAAELQDLGFDGTGIKVAVLDDGADYTHAKLGGPGNVDAYEACAADPTVIGEADCPYFPNDKIVGGYDFTGAWDGASIPETPDPDPIALSFHGTHVADIIGGLPTPDSTKARVRVAHLSPDAPAVDILVNNMVAFSNVAFKDVSDYAALMPGTYNVKVVPAGAITPVVIEANLTLDAGKDYTVAAVNVLASIEPLPLLDNNAAPAAGNAHVRFVHASPDAPAVDIAVAGGGPVLFPNVPFKGVGTYLPVPAGTYDLEVRLAGTSTVVLPLPDIELMAGKIYTAFAVGLVADGTLDAVLTDDTPNRVGPGVAPGADLYAFKVCSEVSTACSGIALLQATDAAADLDGDPATWDPADVINASIGSDYGQPEDDWTAFVNEAVAYGSVYVISAGNNSDKPFVVGSASTATAAISVAQTSVPSDKLFFIGINAPTPGLVTDTAWLNWSVNPLDSGAITGDILYDTTNANTRLGCSDAAGTSPWTPGQFAGQNKVFLVDRGVCAASFKVANANAAGATMVLIAMVAPGAPYPFAYGGGEVTTPAFSVTQTDGALLKTAGTNVTMDPNDPNLFLILLDTMVGTSSRGPRNHDNRIKPDIGAPGSSVSAEFGTGTDTTPFGGTSGAAPMVTGSAALLVQKYKAMPEAIQHELGPLFYKILLMNTGNTTVYQDYFGGTLAPITRIGGGRVDVLKAFKSQTIAWDSTESVEDMRYNTGSMSFGYKTVTGVYNTHRYGTVANMGSEDRWYDLSASFRYAEDEGKGVTVKVIPKRLYVPAGETRGFKVKLTINADALQEWPVFTDDALNKGFNGNVSAPLTRQEYDGYIHVDGGENNAVHLAWQVLPKKVAEVVSTPTLLNLKHVDSTTVRLTNRAKWQAMDADVFALVDASPNIYNYEVFDDLSFIEFCTGGAFPGGTPGPGCNFTAVDLKEVGVRDFSDAYIEFGVTVYDSPFRASQMPVEFDVWIELEPGRRGRLGSLQLSAWL